MSCYLLFFHGANIMSHRFGLVAITVLFGLAVFLGPDGGSEARAQVAVPPPPGGIGVGGFGGGGIVFPGFMPFPPGFNPLGGAGGGIVNGGFGNGMGVKRALRTPQTPRLTSPAKTSQAASVDKEITVAVASDAAFLKLQSSPTGLNYVDAKFDDIQVGQRLSVSPAKKGSDAAKKAEETTGTVLLVNAGQRQLTLKVPVPADQGDADAKTEVAQTVTIRSLPKK
jgi:hypothetical protein